MAPRYWHASLEDMPVGTILTSRPDYEARWSLDCAGRILEDLRPATCLPHRDAVFMCDDPQECDNAGAHCEWLFEVAPDGQIQRHDMEWATVIDAIVAEGRPRDDVRLLDLAARYWSGEPSDIPTWEYLVRSAKVLSSEPY